MLQRLRRDEAGMSLVEAVVALALFAIVSAPLATVLISSVQRTRTAQARVVAAHLAAREAERVRDAAGRSDDINKVALDDNDDKDDKDGTPDANPLKQGSYTKTKRVGSVDYQVRRTVAWTASGATADSCATAAGSGALAYLRVSVEVRWPNMADAQPARAETLLTPKVDPASAATGAIAVRVTHRDGRGSSDHLVVVQGPGGRLEQATNDTGCAYFGFLRPGTYTVTLSTPGYVGPDGLQTASREASVVAAAPVANYLTFTYDRPTTLTLRARDPVFPLRTDLITLANVNYTPSGLLRLAATGPTATVQVFPWREGVQAWAGACADADPGAGNRSAPIVLAPGTAVPYATVDGRRVVVTVRRGSAPVAAATVVARHAPDPLSCTAGATLIVGTTGADGSVRATLPYGTWDFSAQGGGSPTRVTLLGPDATEASVPVVTP